MKILFSEKQRFTQLWLWILLMGLNLLMIYGIIQQIIFGHPFGNNPAPDLVLVLLSLIPFGISWLFYAFCLETKVTDELISFQLRPFGGLNTIRFEEIEKVHVREYSPIGEFGGWGYRVSYNNGIAYNIKGNQGLQLELKNDKKILIGTQKTVELQQVVTDLNIHLT
ncbi:MAG: hypothetical protein AB8G11_07705 [Saprospiraceae bacterium]